MNERNVASLEASKKLVENGIVLETEAVKEDNKMTDREQLCREFTELTGGHWHDFGETKCGENSIQFLHCRECNGYLPNPTYSNPADVLRVMMVRDDWKKFAHSINVVYSASWIVSHIHIDLIIEPDALLKAAVEFLKEGKK